MSSDFSSSKINRRALISGMALLPVVSGLPLTGIAQAQTTQSGSLASWNDGPAKQAILDFVRATTEQGKPQIRAAGRTHRHLRPGRHAVGRTPDLFASRLLPGPRARRRGEGSETQERRAVQDGPLGQPRGDRQAFAARSREDPRRDTDRHVGGRVRCRSKEMADQPPRTHAGSGPTPI